MQRLAGLHGRLRAAASLALPILVRRVAAIFIFPCVQLLNQVTSKARRGPLPVVGVVGWTSGRQSVATWTVTRVSLPAATPRCTSSPAREMMSGSALIRTAVVGLNGTVWA